MTARDSADKNNDEITANDIDCSGSMLLLRVRTKLYNIDLKDIVDSL